LPDAPYKLGWLPNGTTDVAFEYSNTWAREVTSGADRLVIAPSTDQINVLTALAKNMRAPFLVLYVLVISRNDAEPGRYQSESVLDESQLETLLTHYKRFFENDGRHNLWIRSEDESMVIYDRHNVLYAYGALDAFIEVVNALGLTQAPQVRYPDPHSHQYNAEFDIDQASILNSRSWIHSPLRHGDENPV
jgi:hypothetical protein